MDSSLVIFTLITHLANLTNQNPNLPPAPLNKRILFRIVTTIQPNHPNSLHRTSSPTALPPYRPTCPSNPDTWRASTPYMPHMSLSPGHMARFNALNAPHVPQPRTHGALRGPICPTCPSTPDTWRASTPYMPHMSLNPGHMARFDALYAPHVPLPRTHGALLRPICPTCPAAQDTWRTSTPYMPHMSRNTGHMARFNALYAPHVPLTRTHGAMHYDNGTYQNFSRIFTTSVYPKPRILAIWGTSALNRYFTSEISLSISSPVNDDSASFWKSVLHMSGREAEIV